MLALKLSQRSLGSVSLLHWKDVRQEMLESLDERMKKPEESVLGQASLLCDEGLSKGGH